MKGFSATATDVQVNPGTVSFGSVPVGQSVASTVAVVNNGTDSIKISQMNVSGDAFTINYTNDLPVTLAAGSQYNVNLNFSPTSETPSNGQLTVQTTSKTKGTLTIPLTGNGKKAGSGSTSAVLTLDATSLAFGNVTLNSTATQSLKLTSTGGVAVTVNSAKISGTGYSVSGATFPVTLNPSQSMTLSVQFNPTATGTVTGSLTIGSNSTVNPSAVVALSGTGTVAVTHEVDLNWNAPVNSTDPVVGYNIYRALSGTSAYQKLNSATIAATNFADMTAQSGNTYDYTAASVGASGMTSAPSNLVTLAIP